MSRRLTPCHVLFATFIAGFEKAGVLSQGVVNFVARHAARMLYSHFTRLGLIDGRVEGVSGFRELVSRVLDALDWGVYSVDVEGNTVKVVVESGSCNYCPKAVGGSEIPGTACPLPALLESLGRLAGLNVSLKPIGDHLSRNVLVKREGRCIITYVVG